MHDVMKHCCSKLHALRYACIRALECWSKAQCFVFFSKCPCDLGIACQKRSITRWSATTPFSLFLKKKDYLLELLRGAVFHHCGRAQEQPFLKRVKHAGRPWFGSVRLRFGGGRVRAVPVFGSGGSFAKRVFRASAAVSQERTVPVSVSGKWFLRGSDGSGFRFLFGSWATLKPWSSLLFWISLLSLLQGIPCFFERLSFLSQGF